MAWGGQRKPIRVHIPWYGFLIAAAGSAQSAPINLDNSVGWFSLFLNLNGDGKVRISYLISLDGYSWVQPDAAPYIVEDFTKTDGRDGDGKDVFVIKPILSPSVRFMAEEVGGINQINVTAYVGVQ